jgi:flavin reductase (DIM6/NTAB) family NADH-FMN oxidoreductase RutF
MLARWSFMFDEFAAETLRKLEKPGLLLVGAKNDGKSNVMAIGWGYVGVMWRKKVFIVLVRPSRLTHDFIEDNGEFTVNVPSDGMEKIVAHCGTVSGRTHNKFKESKLHLMKGKIVKVPVIKECKIHYECRVIHKLKVKPKLVSGKMRETFYPKRDFHTVYFGEIVAAY